MGGFHVKMLLEPTDPEDQWPLLVQDRVDGWVWAAADLISMLLWSGQANDNTHRTTNSDCSVEWSEPKHVDWLILQGDEQRVMIILKSKTLKSEVIVSGTKVSEATEENLFGTRLKTNSNYADAVQQTFTTTLGLRIQTSTTINMVSD